MALCIEESVRTYMHHFRRSLHDPTRTANTDASHGQANDREVSFRKRQTRASLSIDERTQVKMFAFKYEFIDRRKVTADGVSAGVCVCVCVCGVGVHRLEKLLYSQWIGEMSFAAQMDGCAHIRSSRCSLFIDLEMSPLASNETMSCQWRSPALQSGWDWNYLFSFSLS